MTAIRSRSLYYVLLAIALACSLSSLVALAGNGSQRWTTPLNTLSIILILAAMTMRDQGKG
jgi:ATP-dependent protease ClpP protease subunit